MISPNNPDECDKAEGQTKKGLKPTCSWGWASYVTVEHQVFSPQQRCFVGIFIPISTIL